MAIWTHKTIDWFNSIKKRFEFYFSCDLQLIPICSRCGNHYKPRICGKTNAKKNEGRGFFTCKKECNSEPYFPESEWGHDG